MTYSDPELQKLIQKGKSQGYLTHNEVISYLPDEEMGSEKVDLLISALDDCRIDLLARPPHNASAQNDAANEEPNRYHRYRVHIIG